MLHDTIEDRSASHGRAIEARFGLRVAKVVRACCNTDVQPKPPWQASKEAYLAHLEQGDADTLLVSYADRLHNARAIVMDLRTHGPAMLGRLNASRAGQPGITGLWPRCSPGACQDRWHENQGGRQTSWHSWQSAECTHTGDTFTACDARSPRSHWIMKWETHGSARDHTVGGCQ